MFYIPDRKTVSVKVQAPFVAAEIRALRSSIFKKTPEIQQALAIASQVELSYDLSRVDLFLPVLETFCAILDPLAMSLLTGTLRRIGNEVFPSLIYVLGIPRDKVRAEMKLKDGPDLVRAICGYYSQCVVGPEAGALSPMIADNGGMTVTDTTMMPCQLQMGVFAGAGTLTGLFRDSALSEKRCRTKGDPACVYEFTFPPSRTFL